METPLAAFGSHDGDGQQQQEGLAVPPQPLPRELRTDIRRLLSSCLLLPRLGQRAVGAISLVVCWAFGVSVHLAFTQADKEKCRPAADVMIATCFLAGFINFALFNRVASDVVPDMLLRLEEVEVSAKGEATLTKSLKYAQVFQRFFQLLATCLCALLAIESVPETPVHEWSLEWAQWVVAAVLVVAVPFWAGMLSAVRLASDVSYVLAADAANQVATDVRRTTAATADYDALAQRVHRVHSATMTLSAQMTPVVVGWVILILPLAFAWLFIAVAPRPAAANNWYNFYLSEIAAACMSNWLVGLVVWELFGPARVTSACQSIASAVNDLRLNVAADGVVTLATSEQLHRIEGLKRYANELNKDQGLGFLVLGKRMTRTLVLGLLIQTVSGMIVVSTTLVSIATVEGTEGRASGVHAGSGDGKTCGCSP
jgi:hypothetical protein